MPTCQECDQTVVLPFICNYCGGAYCTEHRIPESHNCAGLTLTRRPSLSLRTTSRLEPVGVPKAGMQKIFNAGEAQQMVLAWLVLSVCFSAGYMTSLRIFTERFIISLFTVGLGFVFHELAHRYTAKRYGCWASFRIWPAGLGLALLLAMLSRGSLIFAAPGAVYIVPIRGLGISRRENGIIALSGIAMNVLLGSVFVLLSGVGGVAASIGSLGARINFWLAAFNLIPLAQLDGAKVLAWSWRVWGIATALAWLGLLLLA